MANVVPFHFGRSPTQEVFHTYHTEAAEYLRPYGGVANFVHQTMPNTTEASSPSPDPISLPPPSEKLLSGTSRISPPTSGHSPEASRTILSTEISPEIFSSGAVDPASLSQIQIRELYVSVSGKSGLRPMGISEAASLSRQCPLVGTLQLSMISKDSTR